MKKSRFLALALVVAVMLMGAGYAYWTDSVVINGTVSTGTLDVGFVPEATKMVPVDAAGIMTATADNVWSKNHLNADQVQEIKLEINNLYPGKNVRAEFDAQVKNMGYLPVILQNAEVNLSNLPDALVAARKHIKADGTYPGWAEGYEGLVYYMNVTYKDVNGTRIASKTFNSQGIHKLQGDLEDAIKQWVLKPGQSISFEIDPDDVEAIEGLREFTGEENPDIDSCIKFRLGKSASGTHSATNAQQGQSGSFSIKLNFTQANANE